MPYLLILDHDAKNNQSGSNGGNAFPSAVPSSDHLNGLRGRVYKEMNDAQKSQESLDNMSAEPVLITHLNTDKAKTQEMEMSSDSQPYEETATTDDKEPTTTRSKSLWTGIAVDLRPVEQPSCIGDRQVHTKSIYNTYLFKRPPSYQHQDQNAQGKSNSEESVPTEKQEEESQSNVKILHSGAKEEKHTIEDIIKIIPGIKTRPLVKGSKRRLVHFGQAPHLPEGWMIAKWERGSGTRVGRIDTVTYSPSGKRFKSKREINNFRMRLELTNGNEEIAYKKRFKNLE